jgi:D-sedoheptulose 7-phosphate isomerase
MSLLSRNVNEAAATLQSLLALEAEVERAAELIAGALAQGRKLLTCGNGGSAADAMHLATEMVVRFDQDRRPYPALCLATSGGDLTAIANDYAFAEVFARQVEAFGQPDDVLVALSTSGRSENVRRALEVARGKQLRTIALLGKDGGPTKGLAEVELLVASASTARIQEAQKLLIHTVCERIEERLRV